MKYHKPKRFRKQHQQRGTANKRGYTYRWQQYRVAYLSRNPLCYDCKKREAKHVDHIKAVTGPDDPLFWDEINHQPLCHGCHSRKTVREDGGLGNRRNNRHVRSGS